MSARGVGGDGEYAEVKEKIEKALLGLKLQIEKLVQDISVKDAEKMQLNSEFNKAKEVYEKMLKSKSITELSSRAIGVYTLLEEELIARQGKILQQAFIDCFSSIINKDNTLHACLQP